jgi:hypothetical protein
MRKPSLTYWNRIEPSPRADSLVRGLEAAVRDPVWFLARQWQVGEFLGEDAGSPSTVSVHARLSSFTGWTAGRGDSQPFAMEAPLESLVEAEDVTPNWLLAVELGQMLARLLDEEGASPSARGAFTNAYQVPQPASLSAEERRDQALVRFLRVCAGRAIDGIAAYRQAIISAPAIPAALAIQAGDEGPVAKALGHFLAWVRVTYGAIGRGDAPAWAPALLDHQVAATARTPSGELARLQASVGPYGEFDWFAFDETGRDEAASEEQEPIAFSLFPTNVNFSGMPNSRWWQFEDGRFNWTNVDTDRREIAKAMILDFMLVQGTDWFMIPFGQRVGSLAAVDQLLVRDVFGELTLVRRADAGPRAGWTMFSTATGDRPQAPVTNYFILAPSALRTTLDGPDLEEVRFLRDEQANLVWAVEARTQNGIGTGWPGHERALTYPEEEIAAAATAAPLLYRLQTNVPVHWIPFPPVQIDSAHRAVALERAAMQRFVDGALVRIEPAGRILNPTNVEDAHIYRVNEEEVSRSGTRILRAPRRSRWLDGTTHSWTSRQRRAGMGEGSSGLRYDLVEQTGSDVRS